YRFYAFLKSLEGGALPDEQIRILVDEDASRDNVLGTIDEIFGQAGPNDLVIFYFSGHGLNGSFLPIDFDGFNNKITHEEIAKAFNKCKAKFKLCLADACHSGSLFAMRSADTDPILSQYYQSLAKSVSGTALIMSSKADETSLESAGLRQGVFSHFLIRGLKGEADKNKDKVVTVDELFDFIASNVRDYTGNRQSPVIKGSYDPKMPVAIVR
ncbi:MAG: caspase family protein, partial [Saprospiraceae bacterium]|nr:caspase family protein [Saprospiraceae bacterium]